VTKEQMAIREAFDALCEHQSPSSSEERKQMALVRCWSILAAAVQTDRPPRERLNNFIDGCEEELS
jgi:hypothetical protein